MPFAQQRFTIVPIFFPGLIGEFVIVFFNSTQILNDRKLLSPLQTRL